MHSLRPASKLSLTFSLPHPTTMMHASTAHCVFLSFLILLVFNVTASQAKTVSLIPSNKLHFATPKRIRSQKFVAAFPNKSDTAWANGMKNSLASILAAASSKIILAPFDTIKTLQQHSRSTAAANPLTLIEASQVLLKRPRGVLELYVSLKLCELKIVSSCLFGGFRNSFMCLSFVDVPATHNVGWRWSRRGRVYTLCWSVLWHLFLL